MRIQFAAKYYDSSSVDDVLTVGLMDSEDDPKHFLILQRAENVEEQDLELGQDVYYVEIGEPGLAGYGGIDAVSIAVDKLFFAFSSITKWWKPIKTIEIEIFPQLGSIDDIEKSLREIFFDTQTTISTHGLIGHEAG